MSGRFFCFLLAVGWGGAVLAQSLPAGIGSAETAKGSALTDGRGFTLYLFDQDKDGSSSCVGRCAEIWRPLTAAEGAPANGDFAVITRPDGQRQWAYRGHPLYTYDQDRQPGDVQGDEFRDLWHVAKP